MNTKLLMTSTSLILGAVGVIALFLPDRILTMQGVAVTAGASLLVQTLAGCYLAFAMMNWAAKDSAIGGVYARPVSLANFGHFFVGTLLLAKYQLTNELNPAILLTLIVYGIFVSLFYWLVFRATGIAGK